MSLQFWPKIRGNSTKPFNTACVQKDKQSDSGVYAMIARTVAASLAGAVPPMNMPTLIDDNTVIRER